MALSPAVITQVSLIMNLAVRKRISVATAFFFTTRPTSGRPYTTEVDNVINISKIFTEGFRGDPNSPGEMTFGSDTVQATVRSLKEVSPHEHCIHVGAPPAVTVGRLT